MRIPTSYTPTKASIYICICIIAMQLLICRFLTRDFNDRNRSILNFTLNKTYVLCKQLEFFFFTIYRTQNHYYKSINVSKTKDLHFIRQLFIRPAALCIYIVSCKIYILLCASLRVYACSRYTYIKYLSKKYQYRPLGYVCIMIYVLK